MSAEIAEAKGGAKWFEDIGPLRKAAWAREVVDRAKRQALDLDPLRMIWLERQMLLADVQHQLLADLLNESDRERYEERAAIMEMDGLLPRHEAERRALIEAGRERLTKVLLVMEMFDGRLLNVEG